MGEKEKRFMIRDLQPEQKQWAEYNFDGVRAHHAPLGMIEEVGELARALLKAEQGIRGAEDQHRARMIDAVGDITIFLADYCNVRGIELPEPRSWTIPVSSLHIHVFLVHVRLSHLLKNEMYRTSDYLLLADVGGVMDALGEFCRAANIDIHQAVMDTWREVKQRDWRKYPQNGRCDPTLHTEVTRGFGLGEK